MIPKITSHEFNDILNNANQKLENIIDDIKNIKSTISKKIKILNYETQYMEQEMNSIKAIKKNTLIGKNEGQSSKFFTTPMNMAGDYNEYGYTFSSSFKGNPINVFNIMSIQTNEAFFRDIADVSINGVENKDYKNILKHDSILDKEFYFEELNGENNTIDVTITIDKTKILGNALFNAIEFDMFLNGSYDIEYIKIYKNQSEDENEEYDEYTNIKDTGSLRLIFNKQYEFNKVSIGILPKFTVKNNDIVKSILSIKHIYFYNLTLSGDSYVYVQINSDEYIDRIYDDITIVKPDENIEISAKDNDITFYLKNSWNQFDKKYTFSIEQETSTTTNIKEINLNVKEIYAKIPLKILSKLKNKTAIGFIFTIGNKVY